MSKIFKELAPMLAGFNLAAAFVGFFGIGAFASWVLESWRPFTHWIWDSFFNWLQWPNLSDLEKDALTAVLFFLPMGVWAVFTRYRKGNKGPFSIVTVSIATFSALGFLYLVAGTLIIETIQISIDTIRNNNVNGDKLRSKSITVSFVTIISAILCVLLLTYHLAYKITNNSREKIKKLISLNSKTENKIYTSRFFKLLPKIQITVKPSSIYSLIWANLTGALVGLSSFGLFLGVAENVGWLRGLSITAIILSLFLTLKFDPKRILVTTGAFSAFIISSVGFEIAMWVIDKMNSLPT